MAKQPLQKTARNQKEVEPKCHGHPKRFEQLTSPLKPKKRQNSQELDKVAEELEMEGEIITTNKKLRKSVP